MGRMITTTLVDVSEVDRKDASVTKSSGVSAVPHAAAGMRWFRHLTAFLWHAALLAVSLAAEYQADKFTVDRAFAEFIRRTRSHFCTSMSEQPNGETKPNHPAYREKVKGQLDRTYQQSAAPDFAIPFPIRQCTGLDAVF